MDFHQIAILVNAAKAHSQELGSRLMQAADEAESAVNDIAQIPGFKNLSDLNTAYASLKSVRDAIDRMLSVQRGATEEIDRFLR